MTIADSRTATSALMEVAAWFARQVVGNELGAITPAGEDPDPMGVAKLPGAFRDAVAQAMVDDPRLGWPNVEEARATLEDLYGWQASP